MIQRGNSVGWFRMSASSKRCP